MPRWIVSALVLGGCGRVAFDPSALPDAADPDAGAPVFDPAAGTCAEAATGPFRELARFPTTGGGYGVWADPPYVLAADTTGGLASLRLQGGAFELADRLDGLGWVEAVWSDGTYRYVGAPGTGLAVVHRGEDGALMLKTQDTSIDGARRGWVADGTVYVPGGGGGLHAVTFDGATLTPVATPLPTLSWSQGAWARGDRVILADNGYVRLLAREGATLRDLMTPDDRRGGATRVWSDGARAFVAHASGVTAYRVEATALVELATFATAAPARDVWSDGLHVFVAAEGAGVYALAFDGGAFALLDRVDVGMSTLGVMGDGAVIYANDLTGGLRAYDGFACARW